MTNFDNNVAMAKTLDNYGDLMTAGELSAFLGISKQTTYKEIKQGSFGVPLRFGREYRIPKVYITQRYLGGFRDGSDISASELISR